MTEPILASAIQAVGMVLASIITGAGVIIGAGRVAERRHLKRSLLEALNDIRTHVMIEKYHTEMNVVEQGKCNKIHVRTLVSENEGLTLSGRNTMSQLDRKITRLERDPD